jgi:hypothetical protein
VEEGKVVLEVARCRTKDLRRRYLLGPGGCVVGGRTCAKSTSIATMLGIALI